MMICKVKKKRERLGNTKVWNIPGGYTIQELERRVEDRTNHYYALLGRGFARNGSGRFLNLKPIPDGSIITNTL